ncbi:hypothetical protein NQZ68_033435 [Dissostichus eleginoides]|nr:hypothetical protein NQZ68_033435 [Dissostichus eleginoides]
MGLLAALVALLCIYTAARGAEGCSSFRHLENGQTFFRYGGLLVIFRCRPGYKLHGYKTNSCVSGIWSRDTPVCVGSGCTNPGPPTHGTSSMNEDGSWTVFSCHSGFRLQGPSMLYCKGHIWNSTKPVCKELDMMGLSSGVSVQKPNTLQNLQAAVVLKTQQQSHYDTLANTASKESNLKLSLSHAPPQMSSMPSSETEFSSGEPVTSWDDVSPSEVVTSSLQTDKDQQIETSFQYPPSSQPSGGKNPGPTEYKQYIQYACYPGYTLAHGDIHSYCQRGGVWSGTTPVCLELTPCSINNGGCSELCSLSQHLNQSSNQTHTITQCHCKAGFTLVEDGRTCRDLDECVEGQYRCRQRCINTFGSFKCSCDDGYQSADDQTSCTDVDECMLPAAVTGCVFGCVNTPGSFHCQCPSGYSLQTAHSHCQDIDECAVNQGLGLCTEQCHNSPGSYRCSCLYGHILAGDGHSCIPECPSGYRKQPTTSDNQTTKALREECVDVNECQEEMCEWQCINLPGSHRCICPRGYTLHQDGRRCKDINECSRKNGGCSHLCVNQKGVYKCACPATHRLSPYSWKKCVPRTTANSAG